MKCEKKYVASRGQRWREELGSADKAVLMALKYPGIRILLVRRTMPELESNHLRFFAQAAGGGGGIQGGLPAAGVPGGSVLELGYCACDGDMDRYQGGGVRRDLYR